ncbi:hypothetical protein [Kitasatospora sp. NBC_01539]|uniref:hypothetical protein n=1 Tax=Kitasatospora sp. NBC_01539 TaxID=2903577 RepID=UPI003860104E
MRDSTGQVTRPAHPLGDSPTEPWAFLPHPPAAPVTARGVLAALRAAEAESFGERRELWGFAAMNAEAAMNAVPGVRPTAGELWAVAMEYGVLAAAWART